MLFGALLATGTALAYILRAKRGGAGHSGAGIGAMSWSSQPIASAVDDDEEADDGPKPGATALAVVSTALDSIQSASTRKPMPIKAFVEVNGDVHTIRVTNVHDIDGLVDLRTALAAACRMSGAPELQAVDVSAAGVQYLNQCDAPAMVTESTPVESLRSAKAFRVLVEDPMAGAMSQRAILS